MGSLGLANPITTAPRGRSWRGQRAHGKKSITPALGSCPQIAWPCEAAGFIYGTVRYAKPREETL